MPKSRHIFLAVREQPGEALFKEPCFLVPNITIRCQLPVQRIHDEIPDLKDRKRIGIVPEEKTIMVGQSIKTFLDLKRVQGKEGLAVRHYLHRHTISRRACLALRRLTASREAQDHQAEVEYCGQPGHIASERNPLRILKELEAKADDEYIAFH